MTLGVIFEVVDETQVNVSVQVIFLPFASSVKAWSRKVNSSNSNEKPRWKETCTDLSQHPDLKEMGNPSIFREATAFVVSQNMVADLVSKGWAYSLPITALSYLDRANPVTTVSGIDEVNQFALSIETLLNEKDTEAINAMLKSERRTSVIPVLPIGNSTTTQEVKTVPTTTTTTTVTQEVSEDVYALSTTLYPPEYAKSYVHRKVLGVDDFTVLDTALKLKQNVLIYGKTGSAKTTFVKAWAASRGLRVGQVSGTPQLDGYRVIGRPVLDNGCSRFQPGLLHQLFRFGGVFLMDEIDLNPDGFLSELFPVLRERLLTVHDSAGETLVAHENFIVVATMNGTRGYRRRELDAAMKNRFTHILPWDYDPEVERSLGVTPVVAKFAASLRKMWDQDQLTTPVPTNALLDFQILANEISIDYAIGNFIARFNEEEQPPIRLALEAERETLIANLVTNTK